MKSFNLIVVIAGSLFFCHQTFADSPKRQAEAFFSSMQSGNVDRAFDDLLIGSPLASESSDKVSDLKAQTKTAFTGYGTTEKWGLVSETTFGFSVIKLTYVQKLDSVALVWDLFFFLPKDKWYVSNIELSAWSLAETVKYESEYSGVKPGAAGLRMQFGSWVTTAR